jgi:hypothetical protein
VILKNPTTGKTMADTLQHKLQKLEIEPPVSLWPAIEKELDEANETGRLSARLQLLEVTPPANAWDNIISALEEDKKPAKLIDLNWRKIAIAASVIAVAGTLSFFLFFNPGSGKTEAANTTVSVVNPVVPNPSGIIQDSPNSIVPKIVQASNNNELNTYRPVIAKKARQDEPRPSRLLTSNVVLHEDDNIEISAPPITDQNGNTILDKALLVSDNSPYITVTSPNGEKTRISAKFLDYLDKLYHHKSNDDEWKNRFENWKRIILQDASLAPAPGNYMDLLELKDLLIHQ